MYRRIVKELLKSEIASEYFTIKSAITAVLISKYKSKFKSLSYINAKVFIDDGKLLCKIAEDVEVDYEASIFLLYYFGKYDNKNKVLIANVISEITEFLQIGAFNLKILGIDVEFDFDNDELKKLLKKVSCYEMNYNIIEILENFDQCKNYIDTKKIKSGKFIDELHKMIMDIKKQKKNEKVNELFSMEVPIDFTNIFDNDEKAEGVHIDNVADGLIKSMLELGRVDIEYISKITNLSLKEVVMSLKGSIYQNPEKWEEKFYKGWEMADEYLSGNIKRKLDIAKNYNGKYNNYFRDNVNALQGLLSVKDKIKDIYVTLGSPWIPKKVILSFINRVIFNKPVFSVSDDKFSNADFKGAKDDFKIKNKLQYSFYCSHEVNEKYGFLKNNFKGMLVRGGFYEDILPLELIENMVNHKQTFVEYVDRQNKKHVDSELTLALREKEKNLNEAFNEFVKSSIYYNTIVDTYNERFVYYVKRNYDGSFLNFPGLSNELTLYPYQKNAVARILLSPNTLLAHEVGSGKTFIMICAGMELKRMGISKKNLYIVPNNIVSQWEDMFLYAYPMANVYCISVNDFVKQKRQDVLKKIKYNDYDAIIMPYSSFDRIEVKASKKKNEIKEDDIYFEDLDINTLFVDEAHNYKNVPIKTTLKSLLGINPTGSKKSADMMEKVHIIQEQNKGRGIVFATGTPITNSVADLYNMQVYLQNKELHLVELDTFDKWREMFAELSVRFEVDVDTNTYRMANRLSEYHNLPELSNIFSQVIDYHKLDKTNGIPKYDGYIDEKLEKSKELNNFLLNISNRVDRIRNHTVSRVVDNMLKVTMDGRRAALDMRIVDSNLKKYDGGKVSKCVENVLKIYRDTIDRNSTQVIFCDISISYENKKTVYERFSVYDELKKELVENGVPCEKIAFIHEYETDKQKRILYEKFNKGIIRILIGSTFKLGIGVNIQKKLIAIHHLDVPWRPSDMIQREGRILREGNENEKVYIFRYITKGTFDAYSWQILETKQKFINQVLSSQVDVRNCVEVDDTVLDYAEAKSLALENPLLKERFEISNEIEKLKMEKREFNTNKENMQVELAEIPQKINYNNEVIEKLNKDIKTKNEAKDEFSMEILDRINNKEQDIQDIIDIESIVNLESDSNIEKKENEGDVKNVENMGNVGNVGNVENTEVVDDMESVIIEEDVVNDNDEINVIDGEIVDIQKVSDNYEKLDEQIDKNVVEAPETQIVDKNQKDVELENQNENEIKEQKKLELQKQREEKRREKEELKKQKEERKKKREELKNKKDELTNLIYNKIIENLLSKEEIFISKYRDFDLYVPTNNTTEDLNILVKGAGRYYVSLGKDMSKYLNKINNLIGDFDKRLLDAKKYNEKLLNDKKYFEQNISNIFPKEKDIENLEHKLLLIDAKLKK